MLGAVDRLVRRWRVRGLGITLITQRPAAIHKNVLTQIEVLIALRLTSAQDRKAVEAWISAQGDEAQKQEVMRSLPAMPIGEAWVWSPGWLGVLERVRVRQRATFDSSSTPKVGERVREPERVAAVDIAALRERFAAVVTHADTDDPEQLRRRVAELEQQLRERPQPEHVVERVDVPVVSADELRALGQLADRVVELGAMLSGLSLRLQTTLDHVARSVPAAAAPALPAQRSPPEPKLSAQSTSHEALSTPQQRILDALAGFEGLGLMRVARNNAAVFSGASPSSSSFTNNLGRLRTLGLIDYPAQGPVSLTTAGRARANTPKLLRSAEELHRAWYSKLSGPQGRILRVLIARYPKPITREALAQAASASASSSSFTNNLGALRSLGLLDYPAKGQVVATKLLFPL